MTVQLRQEKKTIETGGFYVNNIANLATSYISQLEHIQRGDTDIVVLKDNASPKLKDSIHKAHGDLLPNDWIFETYLSILNAIADFPIETVEQLEDQKDEIIDGLVDVYTNELTAWLASNINNVYYLDDAIKNGAEDGFQLLQLAQYKAIEEIYMYVVNLLTT